MENHFQLTSKVIIKVRVKSAAVDAARMIIASRLASCTKETLTGTTVSIVEQDKLKFTI